MSGFELPDLSGAGSLRGLDGPPRRTSESGDSERAPVSAGGSAFGDLLEGSVGEVQRLQNNVRQNYDKLAKGEPVELHDIYVASGKADVAFTLMVEVRNRLVEAWQTLSRSVN